MGLGILFVGYVFVSLFTLAPTYFVTDLVGSFVVFEALGRLRRHAERFRYAVASVYAMFAVSAVQCVYYAVKYVGLIEGYEAFENGLEVVRLAVMFLLTETLLLALSQLASNVGDLKLSEKGVRNAWFYVVNYVFIIALSLEFDFLADFKSAFMAFGLLLRIVCALLNCAFIYSCYMWICLEGDRDMNTPSAADRFIGKLAPKKGVPESDGEKTAEMTSAYTETPEKKKKK